MKPPASTSANLWDLIKLSASALALAFVIQVLVVKPFRIPSGSMQPSLLIGDYIVTSKWSYGYSRFSVPGLETNLPHGRFFGARPKRGDVIVFRPTTQPNTDYIKRLIGLPGDRIQMIGGVLHINDAPVGLQPRGKTPFVEKDGSVIEITTYLETLPGGVSHLIFDRHAELEGSCLDQYGGNGCRLDDTEIFTVPAGHYFFMGDDRDDSQDSRTPQVSFVPFDHLVGKAQIVFFSFDQTTNITAPWTILSALRGERFLKGVK